MERAAFRQGSPKDGLCKTPRPKVSFYNLLALLGRGGTSHAALRQFIREGLPALFEPKPCPGVGPLAFQLFTGNRLLASAARPFRITDLISTH